LLIADTKLATISTAGKVVDSAATATELIKCNQTLLLRDALQATSAGTITANLSGNATTATSAGSFSGSKLAGDVTGADGCNCLIV